MNLTFYGIKVRFFVFEARLYRSMAQFYVIGHNGVTASLCRRNLEARVKPIKLSNSRVTATELSITMNGVQNTIIQ